MNKIHMFVALALVNIIADSVLYADQNTSNGEEEIKKEQEELTTGKSA